MFKKKVIVHHYKPPRKVFLRVMDKGKVIFEREVEGDELVDVLIVKIAKPMICDKRKVSEDYYVMECRVEDISEVATYIL